MNCFAKKKNPQIIENAIGSLVGWLCLSSIIVSAFFVESNRNQHTCGSNLVAFATCI